MQINRALISILNLVTAAMLVIGCQPTKWAEKNPHEGPSQEGTSQENTAASAVEAQPLGEELKGVDLITQATHLLNLETLTNFEISKSDRFLRNLSLFQDQVLEATAKGQLPDGIKDLYIDLFIKKCPVKKINSCSHLDALSLLPQTHKIALHFAKEEGSTTLGNHYWHLLQISIITKPKGLRDDSLTHYFVTHLPKISQSIAGLSASEQARIYRFIDLIFLAKQSKLQEDTLKTLLQEVRPERLDFRKSSPQNHNRKLLIAIWGRYYANHPTDLKNLLSETLHSDPDSFLSQSKGLDTTANGQNIAIPKVNICSFLMDRIFTGALDVETAGIIFKNLKAKGSCGDSVKPFLLAKLLFNSQGFFDQIKTVTDSLKNAEVADADLLDDLAKNIPIFAQGWENFLGRANDGIEFAIITFAKGNDSQKDSFRKLQTSLKRNILLYVQYPMNLAILPVLSNFKNLKYGSFTIKTDSIANLVDTTIRKGDSFLDLGLVALENRPLSYPEVITSFDFAVSSGLFKRVGTSGSKILEIVTENLQVGVANSLKLKIPTYLKNIDGSQRRHILPLCEAVFNKSIGKTKTVKVRKDIRLKLISFEPFFPVQNIFSSYFAGGAQNNHRREILGFQQEFLLNLKPVDDFSGILQTHGAIDSNTLARINSLVAQRKETIQPFIRKYTEGARELSRCQYTYHKESWRLYLQIINLEAQFLGKIHDQMTLLRKKDSKTDLQAANQVAHLGLEDSPLKQKVFLYSHKFEYFTLAFTLRMAEYLSHGSYGVEPLAPYHNIIKNFEEFSEEEIIEKRNFYYLENKAEFVEKILKYILLTDENGGIWQAPFAGYGYGTLAIPTSLLNQSFLLNPQLLGADNIEDLDFSTRDLIEVGLRSWDLTRLQSGSETYNEAWVLKNRLLPEKYKLFGDQAGQWGGLFFKGEETQAPLHNMVADLLIEEATKSIDYAGGDDSSMVAPPLHPGPTELALAHIQDNNSMPVTLAPLPVDALNGLDDFFNQLIEFRFSKIKELLCLGQGEAVESLLREMGYTVEDLKSPLSRRYRPYEGKSLFGADIISQYNSKVYNFNQNIPDGYTGKVPQISALNNCEEDSP